MNDGTLKEVLKVKFLSFTKEEIENIMDEELGKDPEEMDTELIDMCLDILTDESEENTDEALNDSSAKSEKKIKKLNFKKGLLVAAIIIMLISIAVPAGADVFNIDISENLLKIYDEHFRLDTEGETQSKNLEAFLSEHNLNDLVLPQFLFSDCEITHFEKNDEGLKFQVSFDYIDKSQRISGKVTLNEVEENEISFGDKTLVNNQYKEGKEIIVNETEVLVFNEDIKSLIVYRVDGIEYNIELNNITFEEAVEIAGTL